MGEMMADKQDNGSKRSFLSSKKKFDDLYRKSLFLKKSLVPVGRDYKENVSLKNKEGLPSEEYYKWQFLYGIIESGLYNKDYIGVEISFPKGNKNSAPIRIDGCIFDSKEWRDHYKNWIEKKDDNAVEWLRNHMLAVLEFKKSDGKDIKKVFTSQIKPTIKESEMVYCFGIYYDTERLYLFQRLNGKIIRYDEAKNEKEDSIAGEHLSLELTDSYDYIPSFEELKLRINKPKEIDRSKRTVDDLDLISGVHSSQINIAISNILKKMDKVSMVDQRGYQILIQVLALKIFDEKRSDKQKSHLKFYETQKEQEKTNLLFYIKAEEREYTSINDETIQAFITRIRKLYQDAAVEYKVILKTVDTETISWQNENHIKVISAVVENLQDYSFIRSSKTDLYQLVFHRFANKFTTVEKAQFVTPLKLIDFLVSIVNPRNDDSIVDPTVGIADFLSVSYVNSNRSLDDSKLFGADNSEDMIILAKLNMLLNGDGNAILEMKPDLGSILYKFSTEKKLVPLNTKLHKNGEWDNWKNETKLMKFKVVLTNPPFGDNRKFEPKTEYEKEVAELYELWNTARTGNSIDMGLLFLENACRIIDDEGRIGIVLSNSIASIDRWETARTWLMERMRIVAMFDLPANTFADTGVNTTLIVAYKPKKSELEQLKKDNYESFSREIKNIGYEVRTKNRVKGYEPIYRINEDTFEVEMDENGNPLLKEDFTKTIKDFREWARTQEETLVRLFLGEGDD